MQQRLTSVERQASSRPWRAVSVVVLAVLSSVAWWPTPVVAGAASGQTPPAPPSAPAPPAPPAPPPATDAVVGHTDEGPGSWWAYIKADRVMGGRATDDPRVNALREGGPVFWFVRDKREYVVRDAAALREVEQIVAPVEALGAGQKEGTGQGGMSPRMEQATAQMERKITDLIVRTLADGRAKPLKTQ